MDISKNKISVLIPVYGTEQYLKKCLDSVLNQTYPNIEIVVVNDCSKGNANEIIAEYQSKHDNIKLVQHEENKGLFQARVTGIENCTGDFIAFLDSDDSVCRDYYRKMLYRLQEANADVCYAEFFIEHENGEKFFQPLDPIRNQDLELVGEQILDKLFEQQGLCFSWTVVWNKLFKREVIMKSLKQVQEFSQNVGRLIMLEDIAFTTTFLSNATKVVNCHDVYLNYLQNTQSVTKTKSEQTIINNMTCCKRVFDYVAEVLQKCGKFKTHEKNLTKWRELYSRMYFDIIPQKKNLVKEYFSVEQLENSRPEDNYFYRREPVQKYPQYESIINEILDDKIKVVSFDVFDTLIKRKVLKPTDLFFKLNGLFREITGATNTLLFDKIRMDAEADIRKKVSKADITIDDIYDNMEKFYGVDKKYCDIMKEAEIKCELENCVARQTLKDLYEIAVLSGKKVIYTSDMYLHKETILAMLENCGYDKNNCLYLSNEQNASKGNGALFSVVVKNEKVKKDEIIHIGDNWQTDFENANKFGIKSIYISSPRDVFYKKYLEQTFLKAPTDYDVSKIFSFNVYFRNILTPIVNNLCEFPFAETVEGTMFNEDPRTVGYYVLGLHMYALARWLQDNNRNNTLHFIARDGYLPKLAFDVINKKEYKTKTSYDYLSRTSLLYLDVNKFEDMYSLVHKVEAYSNSVKTLAEYFPQGVLDTEKLKKQCETAGIKYDKKFQDTNDLLKGIAMFKGVIDFDKHAKNQEIMKKYFADIFHKNDCLFDIGYSGRSETVLSSLLGYPINSFYICTVSDMAAIKSEENDFNIKCFYNGKKKITGLLREHIIMNLNETLLKFEIENDEKVSLVFGQSEHNFQVKEITSIIQNHAIQFVKDVNETFGEVPIFDIKNILSVPFENYMQHGMNKDANIFDCVKFEDKLGYGNMCLTETWNRARQEQEAYLGVKGAEIPSEAYLGLKIVNKINKIFPKGSKRRKFAKAIGKIFIR